jgi:MFS family permease
MYVAVGDAFPASLRPRVFSLFATAWVLPSIVGPFVAGALVDLLGWRSVFLVVAVFALLSTFFVRMTLRSHLLVRAGQLVWGRGPFYATVAATGAVTLHVAGQAHGVARVLLVLAGIAMLAYALPPLLPRGTLRATPGLPATVAARGVFAASFACLEMFMPLVLQDESGLSPTLTGLVMMTGALGWVSGSTYTGRSAARERYGAILRLGALSLVVGSAVSLGMVPLETQPWLASAVAVVGFTVMGLGMGLVAPLLSALALDLAEPGRQGESGAAIQMSDALGQSVAAGLVGVLFAAWYVVDPGTSYLSGLGLAVLLAIGTVAIVRRAVPPQEPAD